jgi:hypothetical protein
MRLSRLVTIVVVVGWLLAGGLDASAAHAATAVGAADLRLKQTPSDGPSDGTTVVKTVVHNEGSDTANALDVTILVKTASGMTISLSGNISTVCQQQPAPRRWTFMFNCQTPSLAAGHNWVLTAAYSGTAGVAFTNFESVGEGGPGDPSLSNNSSTLKTYLGPGADLRLTQAATAGTSSGAVTIIDAVRNLGPSTASGLRVTIEINSPEFSNVQATSDLPTNCQFVPPAGGFNAAAMCTTTSSLARLKYWHVQFDYTGTPGGASSR